MNPQLSIYNFSKYLQVPSSEGELLIFISNGIIELVSIIEIGIGYIIVAYTLN